MCNFTPRSANQPASDRQLSYAYDLTESQGLDAEMFCLVDFNKKQRDDRR